jgi:hypothetical protein
MPRELRGGAPKNITRLDYGQATGWQFRIKRTTKAGKLIKESKLFSDSVYGGKDKALEAAILYKHERLKHVGPRRYPIDQMWTREARAKNREAIKSSPVTGLYFSWKHGKTKRSGKSPYVSAYWIDESGQRCFTGYSIRKHGIKRALELAAEKRAATSDWAGAPPQTAHQLVQEALPYFVVHYYEKSSR